MSEFSYLVRKELFSRRACWLLFKTPSECIDELEVSHGATEVYVRSQGGGGEINHRSRGVGHASLA